VFSFTEKFSLYIRACFKVAGIQC